MKVIAIIAALATKLAVWANSKLEVVRSEDPTATELEWKKALAEFEKVGTQWRQEFFLIAERFEGQTSQKLNLGLIHSGQLLDPKNYGAGTPLFWAEGHNTTLIPGIGKEFIYGNINVLRRATNDMLRVRPTQFIDRSRQAEKIAA